MRYLSVVMLLVLSPLSSADAQISIQIGIPSVSIGFSQPYYPELVAVPGYPVYYAPGSDSNFFFYDGLYWVYEQDNWYASSWYNGPWSLVAPYEVPVFILRVPVLYYRHPPTYFGGWQRDAPPRWGDHWGHDWERQRGGWDRWDRRSAPAPAPLPVYQRQYSGNRYPQQAEQQHELRTQNYRHEPADTAVKKVYQEQRQHAAQAPAQRAEPARETPHMQQPAKEAPRAQPQQQPARETPHMQQPAREAPRAQPQQQPARETPHMQQQQQQQPAKEAPRAQPQQQPAREMPHMQQQQQPVREAPRAQPQQQPAREAPRAEPGREAPRAQPGRAQEQDKGQQQGKDQGRERDR
jgi:hypothetical protein